MESYDIIIFYAYTRIADPSAAMVWQRALCEELGLKGRILLAEEGINGTVEGTKAQLAVYEQRMRAQDGSPGTVADFSQIWFKHSPGTGAAFKRLKIKVRPEIVSLGLKEKDIDPTTTTGVHISADTLKAWIQAGENIEIVDMRNEYEYNVGHFKGSHNLQLQNFRDLPRSMPKLAHLKQAKVVTVCTYGVRCEKASGYLKEQGFEEVYQLEGGIGTYMKQYPGEDFLGSLYVFDERITERMTDQYEVVGKCEICGVSSERFSNCAYDVCHKKMIVCDSCEKAAGQIYCSASCASAHAS